MGALTTPQQAVLASCEAVIARGLQTYIEVGMALVTIRDQRLYLATHQTFADYCDERWQMSRQRAYQLIDASEIAADLSTTVDISTVPETQLRPLAKLPPTDRAKAFKRADQLAGDGPRTAKHIAQAAAEIAAPDLPPEFAIVQRRFVPHGITLTHEIQNGALLFVRRQAHGTPVATLDWQLVLDKLSLLEDGMEDAYTPPPTPAPDPEPMSDRANYKAAEATDLILIGKAEQAIANREWERAAVLLDQVTVATYRRDQLLATMHPAGRSITLALTHEDCAALLKEARTFERDGLTKTMPTIGQALVLLIEGIKGAA